MTASASEERPPRGRHRLPQIIAAAAAGFSEKGYAGASVGDLTEWTGLGRGALYRQIGSKAELLQMIAEQYVEAVEVAVGTIDAEEPEAVLRQWAQRVYGTQGKLHHFAQVFYNERRSLDPSVGDQLDQRLRAVGRPVTEAIEQMAPGQGAADLSHAFLGMVFASYLWFRPNQAAEALADATCRLFLSGIRAGD